jgi:hypothetical protein
MKWDVSFMGTVQKFPGSGGWIYVAVPKKYTADLKSRRRAWGMFPITAKIGDTVWETKLMTKKGGDYFVAFRAAIRKKEHIKLGDKFTVSFKLG